MTTRDCRTESWLVDGGHVVASSVRAARSLANAYHERRRNEKLSAWITPSIFDWDSWLAEAWQAKASGTMLLSPLQERALWIKVISSRPAVSGVTRVDRLAASAQQAYKLLAAYAPRELALARSRGMRSVLPGWANWSSAAEAFAHWIADFEALCRRESAISAARLPELLAEALRNSPPAAHPPLLLIGFDRILPSQLELIENWGRWQQDSEASEAAEARFYAADDSDQELTACIHWLYRQRKDSARLMLIVPGLNVRRGQIERALLDPRFIPEGEPAKLLDFEFSLGVPLLNTGLVRSALYLLRWFYEPLEESELDWLLLSLYCAASKTEGQSLAQTLLAIRESGREQPHWTISEFTTPNLPALTPPASWSGLLEAARQHHLSVPALQSPFDWATHAARLLDMVGWPGYPTESSIAFQARDRWESLLESAAALGFDGSTTSWASFVSTLVHAASETIFATESSNAQLQITEPFPSAGQSADSIWFLGAHEETWPAPGQPHPFIPLPVQREAGMPHSSLLVDWQLAHQATTRILHSAQQVVFSYARHAGDVEQRPSRLVAQIIGSATPLPAEEESPLVPLIVPFDDTTQLAFTGLLNTSRLTVGGAETLNAQSHCPFQSFAGKRLNAPAFEPAETGLNARQRGQLLHAALRRIWSGKQSLGVDGTQAAEGAISTHAELCAIPDLDRFVRSHVTATIGESFLPGRRTSLPNRFPVRMLELEGERLSRLVTEWLAYERTRQPFTVTATESPIEVNVAGLRLKLRLDRIDEVLVMDETASEARPSSRPATLILDYKSSAVGPSAWAEERPDDLQLPLYATEALPGEPEAFEGLLIAQVRLSEPNLCGRVVHATQSLFPALGRSNGLVKDPLTPGQLNDWRTTIENLAREFLAGKASTTPKDPIKTCSACGLQAVCRIYDNEPFAAHISDETEEGEEESVIDMPS